MFQSKSIQRSRSLGFPAPHRSWGGRVCLATLMVGLLAGSAQAQNANPPNLMSYQGLLVDANGTVLAPSNPVNFSVVFRIYGTSTGGSPLWTEAQTVTVDKGNFSVVLGEGGAEGSEVRPELATVFASNRASDLYLGITVKGVGNSEILPRLRMLTAPYSFLARTANALAGSDGGSLIRSESGRLVVSQTIQSTGSGGNARGANAVDLQTARNGSSPGQVASGQFSVITGGQNNTASQGGAVVSGGNQNTASGWWSFIGSGDQNVASGNFSAVPGGQFSEATANYAFAFGRRAKARHTGSIVFGDSQDADKASTGDNQFLVYASGGVGINSAPTAGAALTVSGQVKATSAAFDTMNVATLTATSVSGFGSVPLGLIAMWSGSIDAVPAGWALCNGQTSNGRQTPDLRGRFIVGAGQGTGLRNRNVSDTGGTETVTLTVSQLPAHNHVVSGNTDASGLHSHWAFAPNNDVNNSGSQGYPANNNHTTFRTSDRGRDQRVQSGAISTEGEHTHPINLTSQSTGSGQPVDNMPPFFALAFIMRVQ